MTYPSVSGGLRRLLPTLAFVLAAELPGEAAGDALRAPGENAAVTAHIQHIEAAILDPVIAKGVQTTPRTLAALMGDLHVPGVSIAVIHGGRIEWARGFGVARIGGEPVRPDTLFQVGSISKPVAAMAALRLVQAGRLNLDVDVNQYLTDEKKVTLRELLTHTAGLTVHGFPGYARVRRFRHSIKC